MKVGKKLRTRNVAEDGLLDPQWVGRQFGSLVVNSRRLEGASSHLKVEVKCQDCGHVFMNNMNNMKRRPNTKACTLCNARYPINAPLWLYRRCQAQQDRCNNPKCSEYHNYGGRGIKFKFLSPNHAAHWIVENLGVVKDRSIQLDRINNDGHYEPGNIRWAHPVVNANNGSGSVGGRERFITFRENYPDIKYADKTLVRMVVSGMTDEQIIEAWNTPSIKPKGKYGTFTMQGPYRDLPPTEDWSTTV